MFRITNQMMNNNFKFNVNSINSELERATERLSTGRRIRMPHEDPTGTANGMLYKTRLTQLKQYNKNIDEGLSRLNETDVALESVNNILQRVRELSVQGSNGIYSAEDRAMIGTEVNQLLEELVQIANMKGAQGISIFGGHESQSEPFIAGRSVSPYITAGTKYGYINEEVITGVEYRGDIGRVQREVEQEEYVSVNIPGNRAFWATNTQYEIAIPNPAYTALASKIRIDGVEINIANGDTLQNIVDKINNANLEVRASLNQVPDDPAGVRSMLVLETTTPHQMWLEDIEGGTILRDLGVIDPNNPQPPSNIGPTVMQDGQSIFDALITLRDNLWSNRYGEVSTSDIGILDEGLNNLLGYRAHIGAKIHRLEAVRTRNIQADTFIGEMLSKNESIDISEEIMNMKWLENVFNTALGTGARLMQSSLLNFLR